MLSAIAEARTVSIQRCKCLNTGQREHRAAAEQLDIFAKKLNRVVREDAQSLKDCLEVKYERLTDFTITLFGKTMAGKSTIREAIVEATVTDHE